jgi:hypothetical protein
MLIHIKTSHKFSSQMINKTVVAQEHSHIHENLIHENVALLNAGEGI